MRKIVRTGYVRPQDRILTRTYGGVPLAMPGTMLAAKDMPVEGPSPTSTALYLGGGAVGGYVIARLATKKKVFHYGGIAVGLVVGYFAQKVADTRAKSAAEVAADVHRAIVERTGSDHPPIRPANDVETDAFIFLMTGEFQACLGSGWLNEIYGDSSFSDAINRVGAAYVGDEQPVTAPLADDERLALLRGMAAYLEAERSEAFINCMRQRA
jgi:hypothetical protein